MALSGLQKSATDTVVAGPATLWGFGGSVTTAGTLTFRDGGANGTVKITINLEAGNVAHLIPHGMHFGTSLHVTFTTLVGSITFWV